MIARALTSYAAAAYLANCALGIGVATGRIRTGRAHWLHHALYVNTAAATVAATASLVAGRGARGAVLAPALVPLAVIPYAGTRGPRHPAIAASIAPFMAAALAVAWRSDGRRRSRKGAR
ncbi:MAG: hypothetical protein J0H23_10835 [Micrococcales bacterium]|nr:hypothetical protein [Micrococcales bacterium]OJX69530.1 MAG: hypothetical protein BGO94_13585 [Micrococcales bacterium 72-143]